jgi:dihydroorotase
MAEHGFTTQEIARVCATNPGRFVRPYLPEVYGKGFGRVEEAYVGSLTVLDLKTPYVVTRESLKTKCAWSPFEGVTFPGSVRHAVVRGRVYSQCGGTR